MSLPICPHCGKPVQPADAAFCPYCGSAMPAKAAVPEEIKQILWQLDQLKDPVKKHALLVQAQSQHPDSLEIAEALLFLGRLHERSAKVLDYSVIKCYLWHMFLTPGEFSEAKKQEMRQEFFDHPQLKRCQELSGSAGDYTRRYLRRLACEFVSLFLKGSTHYTRSFFGFRFDNRMSRVLARPTAQMIVNIRADEAFSPEQRSLPCEALYSAFLAETGSEPQWLDEELDKLGHPAPRPQSMKEEPI